MSLKKLRNLTLTSERNQNTKSLRKFGRNLSRSHLKTSTVEPNPEVVNRFEQQLNERGITSSFMRNLFERRCEENQIRPEEDKYRIFTRHFLSKLQRTFEVSQLRLKETSMIYFLKGMTRNNEIVGLDLSNSKLSSIDPILDLITYSESICKLHLCNLSLQPKDFPQLFDKITEMERIIHLDLSNRTFQGANKLGESYQYLSNFVSNNKVVQILQLQGLAIRDKGLEALIEGFKNKQSKLISLNLKNNGFSRNGYSYIRQIISHTSLQELDLSDNRLGSYGINDLDIIRLSDLVKLNLSNTDMESEGLCNLLHIIKDHKTLTHLILDRNNYQHNWFKRIEDSISNNRNLRNLSMNHCHITHMDSLFRGLYDNKMIVKLEIAGNNITDQLSYLIELIKRNNSIKELKLKQCGVEGDKTIQLFNSILKNQTLMVLDLADNNIGIDAGKQLLKTVLMNHHLTNISLQKTQIQLSVKLSIDNKLGKNKIDYQRMLRNDLKKQSSILKLKQQSKNVNLPQLRQHANNNSQVINKARKQIAELNQILSKKNQDKKSNLNSFDFEMASLNKQLIQVQVQAKPGLKELDAQKQNLDQMVKELNQMKQREIEIVKKLQKQLEIERNNIKALENKLQKQLDNQKYLNKKNNNSNTKLPLILVKPESPSKPVKPPKTNYKQIKNISKIQVVRPHH